MVPHGNAHVIHKTHRCLQRDGSLLIVFIFLLLIDYNIVHLSCDNTLYDPRKVSRLLPTPFNPLLYNGTVWSGRTGPAAVWNWRSLERCYRSSSASAMRSCCETPTS